MVKKQTNVEEFINVYLTRLGGVDAIQATARDLGLTRAAVASRVSRLRKLGIKLPLPTNNKGYTTKRINELNKLIKDLRSN